MSKPHAPRAGDLVGRNYQIERQLGEGGMGRVYLATHAVTGRRVALKWVAAEDPVSRERVLREARSMGRLSHPNVVGVLDAGEHMDSVYVVMEYVEGCDLRNYVARVQLAPSELIDLLLPAMSGVAAAHQAGILHRDLKPENLFVCTDVDGTGFDTKVLDFGVAKAFGDAETSLTSSGTIVGTPKYMAPEQFMHGEDLDQRVDVYALGLILYELLAGKLPYAVTSLKTMVVEILAGRARPLAEARPDLPSSLCNAVMEALASDRALRHPDVAAFARAIEPFAQRRRFEPPRAVHTPETKLSDVTSPEFEAITSQTAELARLRAVGTAPTETSQPKLGARSVKTRAGMAALRQPKRQSTERTVLGRPAKVALADSERSAPLAVTRPAYGKHVLAVAAIALALLALGLGWKGMQRAETPASAQPAAPSDAVTPGAPVVATQPTNAAAPAAAPVAPAAVPVPVPAPTHAAAIAGATAGTPAGPAAAAVAPAPRPVLTSTHVRRGARTREQSAAPSAPAAPAESGEASVKTRGGVLRKGDF